MNLRTRTVVFALLVGAVIAANASTLRALLELALHDDTSSHVVLIPLLSAALIFMDRAAIFARVGSARVAGAALCLLGAAFVVVSRLQIMGDAAALEVAIAAVVVLWVGAFLLCFGPQSAAQAIFPLVFLVFMIPLPSGLIGQATGFLKAGSRDTVSALFSMTRTPYYREGFTYSLPNLVIEIADECSGIRSSIALFLTTLVCSYLFLRTGWKRAVVVLAAFPLAILKNGIRIVTLSLLAIHVDPAFLAGELHRDGGVLFFLLTLAMLAPLVVVLHNSEAAFPRVNQ
jgi:exosortase